MSVIWQYYDNYYHDDDDDYDDNNNDDNIEDRDNDDDKDDNDDNDYISERNEKGVDDRMTMMTFGSVQFIHCDQNDWKKLTLLAVWKS